MKVIPGILEKNLEETQQKLSKLIGVADRVHIDIIDGRFADNLTIGASQVKKLRTQIPYFLHLMVLLDPLLLAEFGKTAATGLIFYKKSVELLNTTVEQIKGFGKKVGIALEIEDEVDEVEGVLDRVNFVLVMGVHSGFAGQQFFPEVLAKISQIHNYLPDLEVGVDGGVDEKDIKLAKMSGANFVVVNSALWEAKDIKDRLLELQRLVAFNH